MSVTHCSVEGCEKPQKASTHGLCGMHRERVRRYGSTDLPPSDPKERITSRMDVDPNGCWLWTGCLSRASYPRLGGKWAHRVAYELFVGPIPSGLHLDHLCRVPRCVNPKHLEPVTPRENVLRSDAPNARAIRLKRCKYGHEMTPENTYVRPDGMGNQCRQCSKDRLRRYGAAKKKVA